jgi:hypothetical protein
MKVSVKEKTVVEAIDIQLSQNEAQVLAGILGSIAKHHSNKTNESYLFVYGLYDLLCEHVESSAYLTYDNYISTVCIKDK